MTRALLIALGGLVFTVSSASAARVETLPGVRVLEGLAAVSSDGRGAVALAYTSRRGIEVSVRRRGRGFARARLVATRRAAGSIDDGGVLGVKIGADGTVLVVWSRSDGTLEEDVELRDEGCCQRVHAAVLRPDGRLTAARRLSPAGTSAELGPFAVGPTGRVAVSWSGGQGRPSIRTRSRRGGWRRVAALRDGSTLLDVAFSRSRLTSVYARGAGEQRTSILVRGEDRSLRRLGTIGFDVLRSGFVGDRRGGLTGVLQVASDPGNHDQLVEAPRDGRTRIRDLRLAGDESAWLAASPSGAAAVVAVRGLARRLRVRLRRPGGSFGRWVRLSFPGGRLKNDFEAFPSISPRGRLAVWWALGAAGGAGRLYLAETSPARGGARGRLVYRYPGETEMLSAVEGVRGPEAVLLLRSGRIRLVQP